ncbi:MAG: DMT family transporter [Bacteroidales bacterium]|nr:DMT family transporter [Bacteroidales bacterium]MBN2762340.1 DMT family transporter [Bacteroidales bacterium]
MSNKQRFIVYTAVILAMMFWGMTYIWYKQVYVVLRPLSMVFLRLLIATPVLLVFSFFAGKLQRINRKDLPVFMFLAFFEPFLYFVGESFGIKMISSTLASVIIATVPFFTPIAALIFFHERFTLLNFTGIVISIIGISIVITGESGFSGTTVWGVLLMFVAVFSAVGYSVLVKRLTFSYNSFSIVSWQNFIGLLYFVPLVVFFEWDHVMQIKWTMQVIIPLFELALFGSALAFVFFTYSIKQLGVARASVFPNLIPVFTAVFSYFVLKDRFTFFKLSGIVVVIGGLFLTQLNFRIKIRMGHKAESV